MPEFDALDCYPTSFISNNDGIATRLQMLSNDTLLDSVFRFCANVSRAQRTKAGLTKLIMEDFRRETNRLVQLSNEGLCEIVSPSPDCLKLKLLLASLFVHNRYGSMVASHLLCQPTRWNPPLNHLEPSARGVRWV